MTAPTPPQEDGTGRPSGEGRANPARSAGTVTLGEAAAAILRYKVLVIFLTLAGGLLGVFASFYVEDSFEATATLILDRPVATSMSGRSENSSAIEDQAAAATATETINSLVVIDRALDRLSEDDLAALSDEGGIDSPDGEAAAAEDPGPAALRRKRLVDHVPGNLTVSNNGRSYLIEIVYHSRDPDLAANVANAIAREYIAFRLEMRRNHYKGILSGVGSEMEQLKSEVMEAEREAQVLREEVRLLNARTDALVGGQRRQAIEESATLYARQREAERAADAAAEVFERLLLDQRNLQMRLSVPDVEMQIFSSAVSALRPNGPDIRPVVIALGALTGFLLSGSIAVTRARRRPAPARSNG